MKGLGISYEKDSKSEKCHVINNLENSLGSLNQTESSYQVLEKKCESVSSSHKCEVLPNIHVINIVCPHDSSFSIKAHYLENNAKQVKVQVNRFYPGSVIAKFIVRLFRKGDDMLKATSVKQQILYDQNGSEIHVLTKNIAVSQPKVSPEPTSEPKVTSEPASEPEVTLETEKSAICKHSTTQLAEPSEPKLQVESMKAPERTESERPSSATVPVTLQSGKVS